VLNRANRLTSGRMFAPTIREGRRAGTRRLVVHLDPAPAARSGATSPLVGFVVSKAVGPAVVRNRVRRRLRHLARERLASLPGSAVLVVRALPPAADSSSSALAKDLDRALDRVLAPRERR
jgi:ribonuclease P protein component